jgi:hypothetical protein
MESNKKYRHTACPAKAGDDTGGTDVNGYFYSALQNKKRYFFLLLKINENPFNRCTKTVVAT